MKKAINPKPASQNRGEGEYSTALSRVPQAPAAMAAMGFISERELKDLIAWSGPSNIAPKTGE